MQNVTDIFKVQELKKRILFVMGALAIYRLGAIIPIPGINTAALQALFNNSSNSILGFLNIFSGGALGRFSIFSLGVMPYINASIIMILRNFRKILNGQRILKHFGNTQQKKH